MRYAFIHAHHQVWPVRLQCRVLAVSVSGFYQWRSHEPGPRARRRQQLGDRIALIHVTSRCTYGSPRVFEQLQQAGEKIARKTVESIMRERDLQGKCPCKRKPHTTDSDHNNPVTPQAHDPGPPGIQMYDSPVLHT